MSDLQTQTIPEPHTLKTLVRDPAFWVCVSGFVTGLAIMYIITR